MTTQSSGCSSFLKAALVVFAVLTVIGVLVIGGGWYWWSKNKNQLLNSAKSLRKEAQDAGKKTDEEGCLGLAMKRLKNDGGITNSVSSGLFLEFCLEASRLTPGFCDGVPSETDILESARWRVGKCRGLGMDPNPCQNVVGQIQRYCHSSIRTAKEQKQNP